MLIFLVKIFLVAPTVNRLGAQEKDIVAGIRLLQECGFEVLVHTISSNRTLKSIKDEMKTLNHRVKFILLQKFWPDGQVRNWINSEEFLSIYKEISTSDFDVLWTETSDLSFLRVFTKKVHLSRSHNFDPLHFYQESKSRLIGYIRFALKLLNLYAFESRATRIFSISPNDLKYYRFFLPFKKGFTIIPLRDLCLSEEPFSQPLRRPNFKKVGLCASSFSVHHNLEMLKKLAHQIAPKNEDIEFHVFGAKIPNSFNRGIAKNLILRGWVEKLDSIYEDLDVFIVPSKRGMGMKSKVFEPLLKDKFVITYEKNLSGFHKMGIEIIRLRRHLDLSDIFGKLEGMGWQEILLNNRNSMRNLFEKKRISCLITDAVKSAVLTKAT